MDENEVNENANKEFTLQKTAYELWYKDFVDRNSMTVNSRTEVVLPTLFDAWLSGQAYILGRIKVKVD